MSDITQMVIALVLYFLLDRFVKSYRLRKGLALLLVAAGAVGCVAASNIRLLGFDLGLSAIFAVALGIGLFLKRRRFEPIG